MSRTAPTNNEEAGLRFYCAYCTAVPGEWCRVGGSAWPIGFAGHASPDLHNDRWKQIREINELTGYVAEVDEYLDRLRAVRLLCQRPAVAKDALASHVLAILDATGAGEGRIK